MQDDYLDCFGAPEVIGKIGTDIEDFKCSWLVVKALELADQEQSKLLHVSCINQPPTTVYLFFFLNKLFFIQENYGKKDPASVAKVKELYHTLNLQVCL